MENGWALVKEIQNGYRMKKTGIFAHFFRSKNEKLLAKKAKRKTNFPPTG
jgi:hypothetical protein